MQAIHHSHAPVAQKKTTGRQKPAADFFATTYTQKYPGSCAAACLFFIARNLSLQKHPLWRDALRQFPALADSYPYPHYDHHNNLSVHYLHERDIYKITSGFEGKVEDVHLAGGSNLENIAKAILELGLTAKVYRYREDIFPDSCFDVLSNYHIHVEESQPTPGENEFEMKLCAWSNDERQHWVVVMCDGQIMEPVTGLNYASLEQLNNHCSVQLEDLGLSIILTDTGKVP